MAMTIKMGYKTFSVSFLKPYGFQIIGEKVYLRYSRVQNKRSPTIINFLTFFQGLRPYSGLHSIR